MTRVGSVPLSLVSSQPWLIYRRMFKCSNEILLCDALIVRKFGEVDSKPRGARHRLPAGAYFWATSFVIGRAQNESISRRRHKWHNPRKGAREVSDFATASLIRGCIKDCLWFSSFFHLCLMKTFVHLDFPLPTSLAPRHVCISQLLAGSPLLPSAFLSQANAMHPLKIE
jgi:hypothetical protein